MKRIDFEGGSIDIGLNSIESTVTLISYGEGSTTSEFVIDYDEFDQLVKELNSLKNALDIIRDF